MKPCATCGHDAADHGLRGCLAINHRDDGVYIVGRALMTLCPCRRFAEDTA